MKDYYPLRKYNTFGLNSTARYFAEPGNEEDLLACIQFARKKELPIFILGGGSNVLLPDNLDRVVLHPIMDQIEILREDEKHIEVHAAAGVDWDFFVAFCVENNWQGLENLSLIPGNAGASPIQNIGAYGVEASDFIVRVRGIHLDDLSVVEFNNEACWFGYRDSIFKNELKNKVVITSVIFRLNKKPHYNISYKPLQELFQDQKQFTAKDIRETVIRIRQSKLPDPEQTGNAGSFFKNPVVTRTKFRFLRETYANLPFYETDQGIKIPAAWLLEKAGWKGFRDGEAGCHDTQPLVIVNYGKATFQDIQILAEKIVTDIKYCFNISLEKEVNIIS